VFWVGWSLSNVYLEGRLHTREWQDEKQQKHQHIEIVASRVQFLGKPEQGEPNGGDDGEAA